MSNSQEHIRNIALAGHAGAGKTTLFEALLLAGAAISSAGTVERGDTVSDFDPLEREHHHSIDTALASVEAGDCRIQLIDTPGYADFRGPTLSAMNAVETMAVVVDAAAGIEHGTRRMMEHAGQRKLARILVVNGIDRVDGRALEAAGRRTCASSSAPNACRSTCPPKAASKVLDCFFHDDGETDFSSLAEAHRQILDQVVEINENGHGALPRHRRRRTRPRGTARRLRAVPARGAPGADLLRLRAHRRRRRRAAGTGPPPAAQPGRGQPAAVRAQRGRAQRTGAGRARPATATCSPTCSRSSTIPSSASSACSACTRARCAATRSCSSTTAASRSRSATCSACRARSTSRSTQAGPGEIAAVAKVDEIHFDAVLHDAHDDQHIHLAPLDLPQPMFALALEPAHKGQEQKLSQALQRLCEEDPCLRVEHHKELNETVLRGLGDLHLKTAIAAHEAALRRGRDDASAAHRLPRDHQRQRRGPPPAQEADRRRRAVRRSVPARRAAAARRRLRVRRRGQGRRPFPASSCRRWRKACGRPWRAAPSPATSMQDVRVIVHDGKHHPVDSKEIAFVTAGRKAFLDAVAKAAPAGARADRRYRGLLARGQRRRRHRFAGRRAARASWAPTPLRGGELVIKAQVPLAELTDYQTELKSMTGGQGRYSMEIEPLRAGARTGAETTRRRLASAGRGGLKTAWICPGRAAGTAYHAPTTTMEELT